MSRNDDHMQDALHTQKLEWVTPKISLMEAGDAQGNGKNPLIGETNKTNSPAQLYGPS